METINNIELKDKDIYPDQQVLKSILGATYQYYVTLLDLLDGYGMDHEWRYYLDGKV